jgi:hypothetical protein
VTTRSSIPRFLKIVTIPMALLFLLSVVVQYNDPDPLGWIAIYGAALATCIIALLGRLPRWLPAVVGVAAALWAAILLPTVLGQVSLSEMFRETGMATLEIEEARETLGLALVAIWMLVLFATVRPTSPS